MPIYAYRCGACGFRKDVLQKMSDPALSVCPSCGAESFAKQLSAPAFQLKGTGWYATDFKDKDKAKKPEAADAAAAASSGEAGAAAGNGSDKGSDKGEAAKPSEVKKADGKGASSDGAAPPAPAVVPPAKPAAKGGGSTGTPGSAGTASGGSGAS